MPLGRPRYRLIISPDPAVPAASLQGWAVSENLSARMANVDLSLDLGNPVTFRHAI